MFSKGSASSNLVPRVERVVCMAKGKKEDVEMMLQKARADERKKIFEELEKNILGTSCIEAEDGSCLDAEVYLISAKIFNELKSS